MKRTCLSEKPNFRAVIMLELPKIRILMKVRNEAEIIQRTLDHWSHLATAGFYIYDDVSTDNTVEICRKHPKVIDVIQGEFWDPNREKAEWMNRQKVLMRAQQDSGERDWFAYIDADEFIYAFDDFSLFDSADAIACRLYDLYITPYDKEKNWWEREYVGPEFRTIVFFFRNSPYLRYDKPDQRQVDLEPGIQIPIHGDIKHISKGQSIESWERTCDYYIKYWPKYSEKWQKRKGNAVKKFMLSDFGNPLIKWKDREYGFSLESQPYGKL